ncbi:MAG TPA: adenylate/guanylate cyclase domain-containing protein [Acidimicrobiales bacterium]|nr:adenylate/guanylate cyclase domain-containing protein [Acidimicrobiales bacterium]
MPTSSEIHYAKSGDRHIGYQVLGEGPIDLLALNTGCNIWMDRDDEPHWSRFDHRLASFSRLIRFDPSGIGLSDPLVSGSGPTIECWTQDAVAVLDAVGSRHTALFGVAHGGLIAMSFSATYPERTSALVLMHCFARGARDTDYPWGWPQDVIEHFVDAVTDPGYRGEAVDDVALTAPSLARDVEFRSWWKRAGERSGPATAQAQDLVSIRADIRSVLPLVDTPTLVLHRVENPFVRIGQGRYLAENIAGAKLVELPGEDHLPFAGDTDTVLGEIEEFLTGTRGTPNTDRALGTILFTDISESTKRAADSGDRHWRELLDNHDRMAGRQVHRFGGRQVKTTGDGILATFDGPARAIQCGLAICDGAHQLGIEVRVGVHTGEVERRGDDIGGIGVHIAARVQAHAQPGEVWVSRTVTDLVTGSGITFQDRGEHPLKGVPEAWRLFSVEV